MKYTVLTLLLTLVVGFGDVPLAAQQPGKLADKDVKDLAKALTEYRRWNPNRSRERKKWVKAEGALKKALARAEKNTKGGHYLAMVDSWSEVFTSIFNADKKENAGKGRVKTAKTFLKSKGQEIGYEYAFRLPSKYDGRKNSYPLIICLHDKGSTGEKYLKEVWEKDKALADQFILLSPTVGERTVAKNRRDRSKVKRIGWFDRWHLFNIFYPLREILQTYSVDVNRIYIEGTGYGGETALQFAALRARDFAGVVARSAKPRRPELSENLLNLPVMMVSRKGTTWADEEGSALKASLEEKAKASGMKLQFKEFDPLPDDNAKRKALGTQKKDPVHDATAEIVTFFNGAKRDPYPERIQFVTDSFMFRDLPWIRLKTVDANAEEKRFARIHAKVDRENNKIDLTTENVVLLIINLNDKIVDLDKPVKVAINGKDHLERKLERDLEFLLDYNKNAPFDPGVAFTANILVTVPVEEEKKKEEGAEGDGGGGDNK